MDSELRRRLDAIIALLVLATSGVLGIVLVEGAIGATVSVFVAGVLLFAFARRSASIPA